MQQRYTVTLLLILFSAGIGNLFAQGNNFRDYIIKKGESVQEKTNRNIFIRAIANRSTCYVGEPVTVTYKLYSRLGNVSTIAKNPDFNGFSVIDIAEPEVGISSNLETLDGRAYYVSLIRQSQIYPLQPGVWDLGQAMVRCNIRFTRDEFISQFDENGKPEFIAGATTATACFDTAALIQSKTLSVTVKPLPELNKPSQFHGAVGNYRIEALLEKDSLTTDETGRLRLFLSGEGNMTLVPAPGVQFPSGLESYEPTVKDGLNRLVVPVSGSKIFDYTFTASKEGTYTIPPVAFSFFDIDSGNYKTIFTKQLTVHIQKGTGKKNIAAGNTEHPVGVAETMFTHRWMIVVPVIVLIITGLVIWLLADKRKHAGKVTAAKSEPPVEEVEDEDVFLNPLKASETALLQREPRLFYEAMNNELRVFLAHKLQLPAAQISKKQVAESLDSLGIAVTDSIAVQQLLDAVALQLYTPFSDESKMDELYMEAVRITAKLKTL